MKKTILSFICGLLFSGILGLMISSLHKQDTPSVSTVYYLQTGVYKTKDNAINMQLNLSEVGMEGYVYDKDQLYYVICGIEKDSEKINEHKQRLNQSQIPFVSKQIDLELTNNNDLYQQLLEVLSS